MEMDYQRTAKVLKALSDPKRLRIVHMLCVQEMSASSILASFEISQPTLSHDMHLLVETGLVQERRSGKQVLYHVAQANAEGFMKQLGGYCLLQ